MSATVDRSRGRLRLAALTAVAGLASFLVGSVGFSTAVGPPSGDPAGADAILEAGLVEFSFSPLVYGTIAAVVVAAALLVARRDGPRAGGGVLAGVGIWLTGALSGVFTSWFHPDLAPAPGGWALLAGPLLVALAGAVAGDEGQSLSPRTAWVGAGALGIAAARIFPAAITASGGDVDALAPGDDPVGLVALALLLTAAAVHVAPAGRRAFLAGALLAVGILEVTFAVQGLAGWGPSPLFSVGPATFLRLAGGLLLAGASVPRKERLAG